MKKAIWLVLALGALGGVGCSASSSEGDISLTWTILLNGQPASCSAVGATTLEVLSTRNGSSKTYRDTFNCSDMSGRIDPVPTGTYTVEINLLDNSNNVLNLVDVVETNVRVTTDATTALGNFPFGFTSPGKATLQVKMGSASVTGGNCNPTNPNNGAGVALQEIRITSATQCMAFTISGITDMNNAPTTAQTCQKFLCQLQTTVHTVNGLPDGNYLVQVFGYKGATSAQNAPLCYISNAMPFTISGGNTVNVGQITAPFDDSMDTQHLCNATKPAA